MSDLLTEVLDPEEKKRMDTRIRLDTDALRQVVMTRLGRRFIYQLMQKAGMDGNPFTGEINSTNYNCGRKSVASDLKADIEAINRDAYILILREAKEDDDYVNGTSSGTDADYDPTS